jgi:hypothetical protein
VTTILTAAAGVGLNHFFVQRPALKRDARYMAQRLAIILEKFAVDCATSISENDLHDSSGGHAGTMRLALPALTSFPAEADWKAIPPDLVDRVLSMTTAAITWLGPTKRRKISRKNTGRVFGIGMRQKAFVTSPLICGS